MKKAVIYSRVSTVLQDYTSQTAELKREAESQGYEVTHIYEETESGFVDERPELAKVLALTKADTDAVFVWEISRLSRRTVMVLSVIEEVEKKGILIYAKNENYKSWNEKGQKDSTSKLILTIYASIAESEAQKLKERAKRGLRYRVLVEKKTYTSKKVFGYDRGEDEKFHINEEEAAIIRDMFQKCIEGYSIIRLLAYLKSQYNLTISRNTVANYLKNTAYKGSKAIGVRAGISESRKKKLEEGTSIIYFNPETDVVDTPAIVTPEVFEAAQRAMAGRKLRSNAKESRKPSLLKGLIVCPRCGRAFTNTSVLYACSSAAYGAEHYCGNTSLKTQVAEELIWKVTKEVFSEAIAKEMASKKAEPIAAEIALLRQEIEGYNDSIADFKRQKSRIAKAIALMEEGDDTLLNELSNLKKKENLAKTEILDREAKIELLQKRLDSPTEVIEITEESEKFEYLHKVVEAIFFYGDRSHKIVTIQYLNGITVHCIRAYSYGSWYWFFDKGELVIEDATTLQKASPVDLGLKDSIYIDVTSSNSAYYSGEDTDVEIFGTMTTQQFYSAMLQNKQLTEIYLEVESNRFKKK